MNFRCEIFTAIVVILPIPCLFACYDGKVPKRTCWQQPDCSVAVLVKRPRNLTRIERVAGCDVAERNHLLSEKVHLCQRGNVDGSRVLELWHECWMSVFWRMHTLRTDPEGAWSNREVRERLSVMQSDLEHHLGKGIVVSVGHEKTELEF